MTYRDDGDARAARIDVLDHELAAARQRIAELEAGAQVGRVVRITRTRGGEVYTFDRGMGYEQRCEIARGLSDHLGMSGAVELAQPLVIWRGGGKRLELEGTTNTTTLTCCNERPRSRADKLMLACWTASAVCVASWEDSTVSMVSLVASMVFVALGLTIALVCFLRGDDIPPPAIGDRAAAYLEEACLAPSPRC